MDKNNENYDFFLDTEHDSQQPSKEGLNGVKAYRLIHWPLYDQRLNYFRYV